MSDNDSDDEIDVKDLKDEVQMLRGWNVRHNAKIEEIRDDIRYIRGKIRELETGNHNRRSRRGNIRNRPARTGGGRRTRRSRRKKRTKKKGGRKRGKSRRKKGGKSRRKRR